MGNSPPHACSSYQELISSLEIWNTCPDKVCSGHETVTYDTLQNIVKNAPCNISMITTTDTDDLPVQDLGISLSSPDICDCYQYGPHNEQDESPDENEIETADVQFSVLTICDAIDYLFCCANIIDRDGIIDRNQINASELHTNLLQDSHGAEVFRCQDEVQGLPSALDGLSNIGMRTNSTGLSPPKLVSAFKGSRAQQGLPVSKSTVKWAPDVYDPPVTSGSHTLKGQRRRSRSVKKDNSKQKHCKSKSPRSGVCEKKHATRRSSCYFDPRTPRFGDDHEAKVHVSSGMSQLQLLDYKLSDLNLCASFFNETISRVHRSVAGAS